MNLQQILNSLRAGAKLKLRFDSSAARERFRVAIYKKKKDEDKALTDILDEDRKVLRFEAKDREVLNDQPETVYEVTLWLEDKPEELEFDVEVIPPSEGESGNSPSD